MAPSIGLGTPAGADGRTEARDDFGLDPRLRRLVLPFFRFLHDRYWRVEVTGARNVPTDGPALLISNHSGAVPFDGAMICTAAETH